MRKHILYLHTILILKNYRKMFVLILVLEVMFFLIIYNQYLFKYMN